MRRDRPARRNRCGVGLSSAGRHQEEVQRPEVGGVMESEVATLVTPLGSKSVKTMKRRVKRKRRFVC